MMIDANWAGLLMLWALLVGLCSGWAFGFIQATRVMLRLRRDGAK